MSEPVSSLLHTQLASTFGAHLGTLCERTARALQTSGFTSLLVHAGSLLEIFQDDRTYPFEAHAPFKVWVPLQDAPDSFVWFEAGTRPRLILHQPQDYWYQSAQTPQDYWVSHFDLRSAPDRAAARALLPHDLSGTAYIGDATTPPILTGTSSTLLKGGIALGCSDGPCSFDDVVVTPN